MATGSKRSSSRSNASRKRVYKKKQNQNPGITEEIILFLILGVSVLIFLGTCGLLGSFGKIIRGVLIGIWGMVGYIFPFAFFFACAYFISNKWERVTKVKLISTIILLWVLSSVAQLIFAKDVPVSKMTDYYTSNAKNGGFIGGITSHFLCKYLGMAGTIVILIVLFIICIVLLTDRSILTSVKEGSKIIKADHERNVRYRKERYEVISEERKERDQERWLRRQEKYNERARRQDEKRAAALEASRKRTDEKRAQNAERMNFNASNLKLAENNIIKDQPPINEVDIKEPGRTFTEEYPPINDALMGDEVDFTASTEEITRAREPESIFYGNSTDYISTIEAAERETATSVAQIMDENVGIMSATKLTPEKFDGEMTEITENFCADGDSEFMDFYNNLSTSHKISVNPPAENERQEAYERDVYVDDAATFKDDFNDVSNVFSRRRTRQSSGFSSINNPATQLDEYGVSRQMVLDNYDDITRFAGDEENDYENPVEDLFESDSFDNKGFSDNDFVQINSQVNNRRINNPAIHEEKEQFVPTRTSQDLKVENEKPAPSSQIVSKGQSVKPKRNGKYKLPPVTLLDEVRKGNSSMSAADELNETAMELKDVLHTFGLDVSIIGSSRGPAVTRFEVQMPAGVSVKKITNLSDDIMMSLGAKDIRIEAPIPGKKAVGIEIPNKESTMVHFRELMDSKVFKTFESNVAFGVGKDLSGDIVVSDIAKMPHLLIAGATGSGKSVCINTLIMSILYKAKPEEVKLIMIDPKMVELSVYNGLPHLLIPVVTEPKKASAALAWAVNEMTVRYQKFAEVGVRDMKGYNTKITTDPAFIDSENHTYMPQIVIVVDELADLMMVAAKEVEESICRLAQLARAAGIYLILATQRPSVDVITGLIKANMPSRIAFSVSSGTDSRTILDSIGAERLLGNGDMLFFPRGYNKPSRVQGAFVSDAEVERVVDFIKGQTVGDVYDESAQNAINAGSSASAGGGPGLVDPNNSFDELFTLAGHAVIELDKASIGLLQRKFKIGFNRAARIMDQLAEEGVVGPEEGTKPRKILMSMEQFNQMLEEMNHR